MGGAYINPDDDGSDLSALADRLKESLRKEGELRERRRIVEWLRRAAIEQNDGTDLYWASDEIEGGAR